MIDNEKRIANTPTKKYKEIFGVEKYAFDRMLKILYLADTFERKSNAGRKGKLSVLDSLVITLMYWREYRTYRHIAYDYGVGKTTIGNTVIDAFKTTIRPEYKHSILEWVGNDRLILLTAHRRENLGKPLYSIFNAIKQIAEEFSDVKVVYPIHMNPQVRSVANEILANNASVKLVEPLEVVDFHNIMAKSYIILTDSGGIQEEAPSLGKPVLVMRDNTERPEGIAAGTLMLTGTSQENIYNACRELLINKDKYEQMSEAHNPYGDGCASERIVKIILETL